MTYVLYYPQKPIVNTKITNMIKVNNRPSGINAIVAICCYTGYNQEDSCMLNYTSVQKGMFCLTSYHTLECSEKREIQL